MSFGIFSEKLQQIIKEKGFIEPTLPQKLGMPEIMKGSDVLIIAPTGHGKTETVCLPVLDKIQNLKAPISALYITPLKSLNRDLLDRLFWWGDKLELEVSVRHGDTTQKERALQREMPPDMLITTPETLQAVLTGKKFKEHLKNIKYVIIDEVHELIGSKRGIQLSLGLERLRELAGNFQRIGLSATIGSPELVAKFLGPKTSIIRADGDKLYDLKIEYPKATAEDKKLSDDLFIGDETAARLRRMKELINSHKSSIIFTNTRETAEVLSSRISVLDKKIRQTVHHGSLSKEHRTKSEESFKNQNLKTLIATSSLELGIDIGTVNLVVQYMSPRQVTRLIQRIGRAGHKVTETSKGIILSGDEDIFESSAIARNLMAKKLEEIKMHRSSLDVLVNQIIGICMDEYGISDEKMFKIIKRSYPYKDLKKKEFIELLKFLESYRMIWINKENKGFTINRRRKGFHYYFDNLSMIPDKKQYRVISVIENEPIGSLDEEFVAEHSTPGEKFICSGRAWKIIQVENEKVMVEPIQDIESSIPAWEGELIPVPYEISQEVGKMRRFMIKNKDLDLISEKYRVDKNSANKMLDVIKNQSKHVVPTDKEIFIEDYKDFVIIHSCFGSLINDTIARYLAASVTRETGVSCNIKTDPYRIMLQTLAKKEKIIELLKENDNVYEILINDIQRSSMFKYRFLQIAKRFGIISKYADYSKINLDRIISSYIGSPVYRESINELLLEKMNIEGAIRELKLIKENKIKITHTQGLSYLGELGLVQKFKEVMKPAMPEEEIERAFRKRLVSTRVRLVCVNCADYNIIMPVRDVNDQPGCPKCNSRLIAVTSKYNDNAIEIVKKKKKKMEMDEAELKEFLKLRRSGDLVLVYGKKAVLAMAGKGLGPETAARVLAMMHETQKALLKDILKAEKQFVKTKKYWK